MSTATQSTPPSKRRYDSDASRHDILAAAEKLFVERGYDGVSTTEIAQAASVSQSQIHYHFGSKESLWHELHRIKFHEYYVVQKAMLEGDAKVGIDTIAHSMRAYFAFFRSNPTFARMMLWSLLQVGNTDGMVEGGELLNLGATRIAEGQARGEIRPDVNPVCALLAFLAVIEHWYMCAPQFLSKFNDAPQAHQMSDDYLDTVVKIFVRGLVPEKTTS